MKRLGARKEKRRRVPLAALIFDEEPEKGKGSALQEFKGTQEEKEKRVALREKSGRQRREKKKKRNREAENSRRGELFLVLTLSIIRDGKKRKGENLLRRTRRRPRERGEERRERKKRRRRDLALLVW